MTFIRTKTTSQRFWAKVGPMMILQNVDCGLLVLVVMVMGNSGMALEG